jgi:hypothetical protein
MFDNSIGGFSGILHPLWNWGAGRRYGDTMCAAEARKE